MLYLMQSCLLPASLNAGVDFGYEHLLEFESKFENVSAIVYGTYFDLIYIKNLKKTDLNGMSL